jgi:hypothetical protein
MEPGYARPHACTHHPHHPWQRIGLGAVLALLPTSSARQVEAVPGEEIRPPAALSRLAFVENLGQWNTPAAFVAFQERTIVQAQRGGFVVDARPGSEGDWVRLRFELEGARPDVEPTGEAPLPGLRNYLRGSDPEHWVRGAHAFGEVVYADLYPGIALRLREGQGMPEYDLLVAPGADLSQVVVRCAGLDGLEVDGHGGLSMHSARGVLRQTPPVTWSVLPSGERRPLGCTFVVLDETRFGFRLADHDADLPVVVDPGLEWATYLGGSGTDWALDLARAPGGEIAVVGSALSLDFPNTEGAPNPPGWEAFVSMLDASGSNLVASTLIGGTGEDRGNDVEIGPGGKVYVVGLTASSSDFPTTAGSWQPGWGGGNWDAFLVELSPDLSTITHGSFLGGTNYDGAGCVQVSAPRVLTIAGSTRSVDFPAITPATAVQPTNAGGNCDYFVCRLDLDSATPLLYGTYLGGSAGDGVTSGSFNRLKDPQIHEDAAGIVTLAGRTNSSDIVRTASAHDGTFNSTSSTYADAYVAVVDPSTPGAAGLLYDTYLGADLDDAARALAVEPSGVITIGGWTDSAAFPTTPGALERTFIGPTGLHDGFVARLDPGRSPAQQLVYSTLLAGDGYENVLGLVLDARGRIVAQGYSGTVGLVTNRFPTTPGAFQRDFAGEWDGFVVHLDPGGHGAGDLLYSTFVGGAGWDSLAFGLAVVSETPNLAVLSVGGSGVFGFPTTPGAYQPAPAGLEDGVLLQLEIPVRKRGLAGHGGSIPTTVPFGPVSPLVAGGTHAGPSALGLQLQPSSPEGDASLRIAGPAGARVVLWLGTHRVHDGQRWLVAPDVSRELVVLESTGDSLVGSLDVHLGDLNGAPLFAQVALLDPGSPRGLSPGPVVGPLDPLLR